MPPKQTSQPAEDPFSNILEKLSSMELHFAARHELLHQTMTSKHEELQSVISDLKSQIQPKPPPSNPPSSSPLGFSVPPNPQFTTPTHSSSTNPYPNLKPPKLNLQPFDGFASLDWIFQAEQFFQLYQIAPHQRMDLMPFSMQGEALSWYKWMFQNHQLTTWESFTRDLQQRFGPSAYANHQAELYKLKQLTTVTDYQRRFEKLCNKVVGLSPEMILNIFISSLKLEISRELAILQPHSVSHALGLAKLIESKLNDVKPFPHFTRPTSQTTVPFSSGPTPTPQNKLPIKRLTATQMQESRAQGLCYNCDEKYVFGHKCQPKQFFLFLMDDESAEMCSLQPTLETILPPYEESSPLDNLEEFVHFQLSTQTLQGNPSPWILKFQGLIHGQLVHVLIDTGSSHNVMQPRVAQFLRLEILPTPHFPVMVGNGDHIYCTGVCKDTPLQLQQHLFLVPFYLLPIQGADLVLGIEWLQTLGPITSDFAIPSMTFHYDNNPITLIGQNSHSPNLASFNQLSRLSHTDSIAEMFCISFPEPTTPNFQPNPDNTTTNSPTLPEIKNLLNNFSQIFNSPKGLPPSRPHDHRIPLIPNSQPVNVKPYRYPHIQKDAMTKLLADMLKEGIVIPSTSPFSSPVLFVRKKIGLGVSVWIIVASMLLQ
ncbi:PREDICTED: uncharacterized protein LOC109337515 [Lupinus angustifolius]|uniref:uncharacterized protein LOC109337515 n=1 Tax=Lupinus angustifolius TaxID=3871 RepID=UPI00092F0D45|nr:PREDICTED: uncharacterized protein LOC109337515 [Lupinus angustifolius]